MASSAVMALAVFLCACVPGDGDEGHRETIHRESVVSLMERADRSTYESTTGGPLRVGMARVGGEDGPAILAPTSTDVRFEDIAVHPNAALSFRYGISDGNRCKAGDGVGFRVTAEVPGGGTRLLWSSTLGPEPGPWQQARVPLTDYEGERITLLLTTDPLDNAACDRAVWGKPVIRSDGTQVGPESGAIVALETVSDLLAMDGAAGSGSGAFEGAVEVGPRTTLTLAGEIRRAREPSVADPLRVLYRATVDGVTVLEKRLESRWPAAAFQELIPLHEPVARKAVVRLEIEAHGDNPARARWTAALLERETRIPRAPSGQGPNLLVVLVDTLRADRLGFAGYGRPTTPNLDRFSQQAVVFDAAISQSSWTLPAVATLFTGLYPGEHGVTDGVGLDPVSPTLATILQGQGFTTGAVSASPIVGRPEGFARGFESFLQVPWGRAAAVNEAFEDWLESNRDTRWFGYLHYIDPHDSYDAPRPYGGRFSSWYEGPFVDLARVRALFRTVNFGEGTEKHVPADLEFLGDRYDEEILYWDSEFGKLLARLEELDLLERTVIVVTSDHGEEFFEHGKLKHGIHLYDETVRVPLLIRAPGLEPRRQPAQVETRGILDAALQLLDVPVEPKISPTLLSVQRTDRLPAFSHTTHALIDGVRGRKSLASVRDTSWKLIWRIDDDHRELFNLATDAEERRDLFEQEPHRADEYGKMLEAWMANRSVQQSPEVDNELLEKIRALGYVQ